LSLTSVFPFAVAGEKVFPFAHLVFVAVKTPE